MLDRELRRLGASLSELLPEMLRWFKQETAEDLYAEIGFGGISLNQIASRIVAQLHKAEPAQPELLPAPAVSEPVYGTSIRVMGTGDVLTRLATCCKPVPGDEIIGYVTRSRGVSVHRKDCVNVVNSTESERFVDVEWGQRGQLFPVAIKVEGMDRVGLLRDLSTIIADEKVNMQGVRTNEHGDHTVTVSITLETTGVEQLSRLFAKLEGVSGVFTVTRENEASSIREIA
jgi:GTP pyrophosphokinase